MATTPAPVRVDVATRQGSGQSMQDRIFVVDSAVILLDGATDPDAQQHDGGWIADQLGQRLADALMAAPNIDLQVALADAIRNTADRYDLEPSTSPSTTVAIARWNKNILNVLVLGDSPAVIKFADGTITVIEDDRLDHLPQRDRFDPRIHGAPTDVARRHLVAYERSQRNRPGGYWIASSDPAAAFHALTYTTERATLTDVLLVSDGVEIGIKTYKQPPTWLDALTLARHGAQRLIEVVEEVENSDPHCARWPRSKPSDDKAVALIQFAQPDNSL